MKIQITYWLSGSVLFEHEAENNTLRITLEAAVKAGASLIGARLDGARLDGARLDGARLDGASLIGASLDGASLIGASLDGASLDGARLDGARLDGASLIGASLIGARLVGEVLSKAPISLFNLRWHVLITATFMKIGCKRYRHDEWKNFTDSEIEAMDTDALAFWRKWKTPLLSLCDAHKDVEK
jgi:hypothetical protein